MSEAISREVASFRSVYIPRVPPRMPSSTLAWVLAITSLCAVEGHAQPRCSVVHPPGTALGDRGLCEPAPSADVPPPVLPTPRAGRAPCPASMLFVPAGSFRMGSPDAEGERDEHPMTDVTLGAYCFDRTEVTARAYTRCVRAGRCTEPRPDALYGAYGLAGRDELAVNHVDWSQANTYCAWVGGRLPTEAEWEYAARGPDGRRYPWGDEDPVGVPRDPNARVSATVPRGPVGSSPWGRSWIGAEDLAGSLWEWVGDWYAPYVGGAVQDPSGPRSGSNRVLRGGGWSMDQRRWMRAAGRMSNTPTFQADYVGFRCARRAR